MLVPGWDTVTLNTSVGRHTPSTITSTVRGQAVGRRTQFLLTGRRLGASRRAPRPPGSWPLQRDPTRQRTRQAMTARHAEGSSPVAHRDPRRRWSRAQHMGYRSRGMGSPTTRPACRTGSHSTRRRILDKVIDSGRRYARPQGRHGLPRAFNCDRTIARVFTQLARRSD